MNPPWFGQKLAHPPKIGLDKNGLIEQNGDLASQGIRRGPAHTRGYKPAGVPVTRVHPYIWTALLTLTHFIMIKSPTILACTTEYSSNNVCRDWR